jgi:hypothetical protein
VVEALLGGPQRFNDLLGQISGIAANILRAPQAAGAGRAAPSDLHIGCTAGPRVAAMMGGD